MNSGRTVFSQLISFLPDREFRRCVARYGGDRRLREFSCWDQYLTMAFAQLTYRESLRDIEACLRSLQGKLYHLGFRGHVSRSTLADANENRDRKSTRLNSSHVSISYAVFCLKKKNKKKKIISKQHYESIISAWSM